MTTTPPILRNCALASPLALLGAAPLGLDHVVAATLSTSLVLANLWALSILGPRLVQSVAEETFAGLWLAALGAKFILIAAILVGMVQILPPMGIALGFVPLLVGTLATGLQLAQVEAEAEARAGSVPPSVDIAPEEA
ncbi:MAG TPA: hypothetical protein ENK18_06175 [Deltaproteobacteria bacterium]|nr:hypothetical protein [Deltaproteobacteria bacterium]